MALRHCERQTFTVRARAGVFLPCCHNNQSVFSFSPIFLIVFVHKLFRASEHRPSEVHSRVSKSFAQLSQTQQPDDG